MRIIQMLPTLAFGDAIGNDVITIDEALKQFGYEAEIYAANIDPRLSEDIAKTTEEYKCQTDDVIFYHLSTGHDLNYQITEYPCRRIIMYHNITPAKYFHKYNVDAEKSCRDGYRAAKYLASKTDLCIADSGYNKQDLIDMGYTCPIDVLPILIAFEDFKKKPSAAVINRYDDDWVNIVFTGRVVPNKCPQDVIAAFAYYKKYINPKSRLFLVGKNDLSVSYRTKLENYIKALDVKDIHITGQVGFDEILAYYRIADIFLCMSEHEGFCVPLVEAMYFGVPVIAYDSSAISDTLGGSGLLLQEKDPAVVAEAINLVVTDQALKAQIIKGQQQRLAFFEHDRIKEQLRVIMDTFVKETHKTDAE